MARLGSFQVNKFDPILLTSQICGFQSFLYFTLSILLLVGLTFLNINLSLSAFFDYRVSYNSTPSTNVTDETFSILANKCFENRRHHHHLLLSHKFPLWSYFPLDIRETKKNVLGLLVTPYQDSLTAKN